MNNQASQGRFLVTPIGILKAPMLRLGLRNNFSDHVKVVGLGPIDLI